MTSSTLYRLSAVALLASFLTSLAGGVLHPVVDGESHSVEVFLDGGSPGAQYLIYAGAVLLMLGLPGGYAFFRGRLGVVGFIGFVAYMAGNALSAMSHLVVEGFVAPVVAADPDARHLISSQGEIFEGDAFITLQVAGGLVLVLGELLVAVALLRSRVVPAWVGALLLAGAVAMFFPIPEREVLTGLLVEVPRGVAVAALGVTILRSTARQTTDERAPVVA